MKITIEQVEIEQAIIAHVLSQMNVKEGMEITVELRATRGETGMQANINIVPQNAEAARPTAPTPVTQLRRTPALVAPVAAPVVAAAKTETTQPSQRGHDAPEAEAPVAEDPEAEVEVEREEDPQAVAEADASNQAEEQPAAPDPVEPVKPRKASIFGDLNKPKNRPPAE